jgi:hypothetical protein
MALGLSYRCNCGEHFKIYVPKNKVYGDAVSGAVDWQAIDDREEADGEVDDVKRLAESTGCTFINAGKVSLLRCPQCLAEVDLVHHFRTSLLGV